MRFLMVHRIDESAPDAYDPIATRTLASTAAPVDPAASTAPRRPREASPAPSAKANVVTTAIPPK